MSSQQSEASRQFQSRLIDGILYRLATPDDAEAVTDLTLTDFCGRMPLYRHVGATSAADVEVSLNFLPTILGLGESILAVDPDSQELLGARISSLERRSDSPAQKHPLMVDTELAAKYPKEGIVMRSFDTLLTKADYFSKYPGADVALAARLLVVKEAHCGRGIGRRLMECAMELARSLGAQLIVGATQSFFSQRIYENLRFDRVCAMSQPDWVDPLTGDRPFAGLADTQHKEAVFFALRL